MKKKTKGMIFRLFYTENAIMKQTFDGACPTAQRLASSVRQFRGTLQSHNKMQLKRLAVNHYLTTKDIKIYTYIYHSYHLSSQFG